MQQFVLLIYRVQNRGTGCDRAYKPTEVAFNSVSPSLLPQLLVVLLSYSSTLSSLFYYYHTQVYPWL